MDRRHVWRATLGELELSLSQATFSTWFRRTALLRVDDATHTFVIGVASGFAKDWIEDRYRTLIAQTLAKTVGYSVTVQVEVVGELAEVASDLVVPRVRRHGVPHRHPEL